MTQQTVVDIKTPERRKVSLPPVVQSIRQKTKKQLAELMDVLFSNTDDALFELADRSQSDQHQEMYFDSMRVIRLHRSELGANFITNFVQAFDDAFAPQHRESSAQQELDGDDYALLDKDELEMNVAISGIVSKVTSLYSLPVMHLTKRLDSLAKMQTITELSNPLGPHALSSAFADTLGSLDVSIKIRIILMKLFERFVMEQLRPLYDNANQALIDANVLPDLKDTPAKAARSTSHSRSQPLSRDSSTNGHLGEGNEAAVGFETVQNLLANLRHSTVPSASVDGGANPSIGGTTTNLGISNFTRNNYANLPVLPSNELVDVLNSMQQATDLSSIDVTTVPQLADLPSLVVAHTDKAGHKQGLGRADDDTVNFVGMLFDYILNDRNLAIPMKALIGRLQIPIVKLAILDRSFFERTTHPARMLLNELSSAGIGWSSAQELKRDALYNKIEEIVLRVLNEFGDNPTLFEEMVEDLREFVSKDSRRSVLVEQRVRESEAGKAKTRSAKLTVQNVINQKACGLRVPPEVGRFISEVWSKYLTLLCVKYGESSEQWVHSVSTLDSLLWALQPLSTVDEIDKRDEQREEISEQVVVGMHEIGTPEDEVEQFKDWLGHHLLQLSQDDRAFIASEDIEHPAEQDQTLQIIEEIVLTSEQPAPEEGVEPEFLKPLKAISEGTWVEFSDKDKLRCKLATITQPGNTYVFVNRRGMKVVEKNRIELATLLKEEKLQVIDESQVFDRALQSVIGSLRKMQQGRQD